MEQHLQRPHPRRPREISVCTGEAKSAETMKPRILFGDGTMDLETKEVTQERKGRILPYAIAWLIGVPIPILLLIYVLRGCN